MTRKDVTARIERDKLVAVVRLDDVKDLYPVAEALRKGGVSIIELTMTIPGVLNEIEEFRKKMGDDVLVGLGSVLNEDTARRAVEAGTQFVVSPIMRAGIIKAAHEAGVPTAVGAYSPTEIQEAWDLGSEIVKVFPANQLGPSYIKAVRAPMPHLKIMPTGGVSKENVHDWLNVGCCALGVGSALVDMKAIRDRRFDVLTENARIFSDNVKSYKEKTA